MDLQDPQAAGAGGDVHLDLAVEPARPPQGGVDRLGQVGRADDDDLATGDQPVHRGEQLCDDPLLDLARDVGPPWGDSVDLVQEDHGGSASMGLFEDFAEVGLALAVELMDDLWPVDVDEVGLDLARHGAGDEGLA
jgi:hypothetical protein